MPKKNHVRPRAADQTTKLKNHLEETEETLHAIRQYLVDAFVVTRADDTQVVTLSNADFPYRMMVEAMNEGAVTVIPDGTIFYCNSRFGGMIQRDCEQLIGVRFQDLIAADELDTFEALLKESGQSGVRGQFHLRAADGNVIPVQLSMYQLGVENVSGIAILATDIRERIEAEEKIHALASKLAVAEQEERHRISQILHDDLQQRLFAIKTQISFLKENDEAKQLAPDVVTSLDQIQGWLSDAIDITRSLSINLSPILLKGEGLSEAILWLASQMKEQYGLNVKLEVEHDLHFRDAHIRVLLFQAVREALFNVVKHAETLEATVKLEQEDGYSRLTVSDAGKGFDAENVLNDPTVAHGLLIVRDRLNLLGCHLEVTAKPGEGTRVIIEPPAERIST